MTIKIIGKEYLIIKEIESGSTSNVYLVKSLRTEEIYTAKVFKNESKYYLNEIEVLKKLSLYNCPGIINLISYGQAPVIKDEASDDEEEEDDDDYENKQYIILDYIPNKDLFHYIKKSNGLDERTAKFIFYKILKAVEQCHSQGICHRDLKLENILLDENNNPILCDFGFATFIEGEDGNRKLTEYLGTENYLSPEISKNIPYDGIKNDIFSLGVILFCLVFCNFGFSSATRYNKLYKLIIRNNFEQYWEEIGKKIGKEKVNNVSLEFKKLFFKIVSYNPEQRPSIDEILNDDWFKII